MLFLRLRKHDETYVGRMEKGESIEITTCSEEVSQDQREILQERQLINNPVGGPATDPTPRDSKKSH